MWEHFTKKYFCCTMYSCLVLTTRNLNDLSLHNQIKMNFLLHNCVDPTDATAITPVIFFLDQGCRKVLKIDGDKFKFKSIVFLRTFLTFCYPMNNQNYLKTWLGQFNSGSLAHDNFAHPYSGHLSNGSWSANMHALKVKSYWMNSIKVQFFPIFCIIFSKTSYLQMKLWLSL